MLREEKSQILIKHKLPQVEDGDTHSLDYLVEGIVPRTMNNTGPDLENCGSVQYWPKGNFLLKKGHQKFHYPQFNAFSNSFVSK